MREVLHFELHFRSFVNSATTITKIIKNRVNFNTFNHKAFRLLFIRSNEGTNKFEVKNWRNILILCSIFLERQNDYWPLRYLVVKINKSMFEVVVTEVDMKNGNEIITSYNWGDFLQLTNYLLTWCLLFLIVVQAFREHNFNFTWVLSWSTSLIYPFIRSCTL